MLDLALGILLLPFTVGFTQSFLNLLTGLDSFGIGETVFFAGIITHIILRRIGLQMNFLSTLAHELTHAIWGLAFRAKVKAISVNKDSGHVKLSKTNFLIMLAPYFFPFYTILLVASSFFMREKYLTVIFFFTGFSLAFHITSTIETLRTRQPDIDRTGIFFSIPIIYISNLVVIITVLKFISPHSVNIKLFLGVALTNSIALIQKTVLFF